MLIAGGHLCSSYIHSTTTNVMMAEVGGSVCVHQKTGSCRGHECMMEFQARKREKRHEKRMVWKEKAKGAEHTRM